MPSSNAKDRTVIRMLVCLDRKQRKGFGDYLTCDLFNTNSSLVTLYKAIEDRALSDSPTSLSDAELLEGSKIKPGLLDKLCSQLLGHLNQFVPLWAQRQDPRPDYGVTFNAWVGMDLEPELLEREYRKMHRKLRKLPASEFTQIHALQLEHAYAQYQAAQPRRDQAGTFDPLNDLLEHFYLTSKFKYRCAQISAGRILKGEAGDQFLYIPTDKLEAMPALTQAYHQAYQLLQETQPAAVPVEALLAQLQSAGNQFSRLDRLDLHGYLLNSCIRNLSAGLSSFEPIILRIYRSMLAQRLLPMDGHLPGSHFKNIVSIMVHQRELAEARTFITNYQQYLETSERSVLVPYVEGLLAFHTADYCTARRRFRKIIHDAPEDLYWGLEARNMLWKSYFESYENLTMEEHAEMLRLYDSFRLFLARHNRISPEERTAYDNFLQVFNRLIRVSDSELWASTVPKLQALREQAAQMVPIAHKQWLLAAIDRRIKM